MRRFRIGYRIRAIVLVALLTCAAIGATAWVSARSTVAQISDSVDSHQADIDYIAQQIQQYGILHGEWVGVATLVSRLEEATSQRIRLTTDDGEVVVDTDNLHGEAARPTSGAPVAIVPHPAPDFSTVDRFDAQTTTIHAIEYYRSTVAVAICLTQQNIPFQAAATGPVGLDGITYDTATAQDLGCTAPAADKTSVLDDADATGNCIRTALKLDPESMSLPAPVLNCLQTVFQERISTITAVPLLLYIGYRGGPVLHVDSHRILLTAVPMVLVAMLCAALLSRHVLRPVDAVIRASQRLEAGHRTARVPERGRDEMGALAKAFNRMADSVQSSDDRQKHMVADIAHELRTPLANIRGYLEALRDRVIEPTPEVLDSLHEEALLQQRIIDDLQDLALADRDRLIDHRIRTDAGEIVQTARAAHTARAEASGIALAAEVEADLAVDADPDRLRQALGNLLTNAIRATDPGGRITMTGTRTKHRVVLTVTDTGHGIAPEHLPHVFKRFWRADPARARRTGGSGLGLAITNAIVRGHNGTITVHSEVGTGTTVQIMLPAA